jgi:hypothetical protein
MEKKYYAAAAAQNAVLDNVNISYLEGIQEFEPQYVDEYVEYCIERQLELNEDSAYEFLEMKHQLMMENMDN